MGHISKDAGYDSDLLLKDDYLVGDADEGGEVDSAAKILRLGAARVDGRVMVNITAIEVASNDERYLIQTQFSNSSSFASGVVNGTALNVGAAEITKGSADTPTGVYELPFTNEIGGTVYEYMRIWTETQGSIGSDGINYTAYVAKGTI